MGTKGKIKILSPFWCSPKILVHKDGQDPQEMEFPLPSSTKFFNFRNSAGLHYQAKHVMQCLNEGKVSSPVMSTRESLVIMNIMDEIRQQIGLKYPSEQ